MVNDRKMCICKECKQSAIPEFEINYEKETCICACCGHEENIRDMLLRHQKG